MNEKNRCPRCNSPDCDDPDSKGCSDNCIGRLMTENADLRRRLTEAEAIVEKLPLTKDGVRVVPGEDTVWWPVLRASAGKVVVDDLQVESCVPEEDYEQAYILASDPALSRKCYSTHAAAENAAKENAK